MRNKKRPFHFFLLSVLLAISIGYLISSQSPAFVYPLGFLHIPLIAIVFVLLAAFIFSFCTYLFHSYVQGILASLFIALYLFLRLINLTNVFFLILLIILFGTLELFFLKKK